MIWAFRLNYKIFECPAKTEHNTKNENIPGIILLLFVDSADGFCQTKLFFLFIILLSLYCCVYKNFWLIKQVHL